MIILILFSFASLFALYQVLNSFKFGAASYLFLVYLSSFLSSAMLFYYYDYEGVFNIDCGFSLFFLSCLFLIFAPFFRFKDINFERIIIFNFKYLKFLEVLISIFAFFSLFYFVYQSYNILSVSDLQAMRNLIASGDAEHLARFGFLNSVFSLSANLFVLSILFGFLNISSGYPGARLWKAVTHFLLSSVYIFYIFSYVGRDGFVYWTMTFLFMFFLLKDFISIRNKKTILLTFFLISAPAFVVFIWISYSRFSDEGLIFSLFNYAGQQIFNFNDHYLVDDYVSKTHGSANFAPLISFLSGVFGFNIDIFNKDAWFDDYLNAGVTPWVFATFIGSFYHDFGVLGAFLCCLIISLVFFFLFRNIKRGFVLFSDLILFILFYQIVLLGVFYYRHYSAFFYILVMFIVFLFFKLSGASSKIVISKVKESI